MYIQDKVEEYSDEVFDLLNNGAHIYFCGLKGMMPGGKNGPGAVPPTQRRSERVKPPSGWKVMPVFVFLLCLPPGFHAIYCPERRPPLSQAFWRCWSAWPPPR